MRIAVLLWASAMACTTATDRRQVVDSGTAPLAAVAAPADTAAPGPATGPVFDRASSVIREGESACHRYADLTVVTRRREGESGSDIIVRHGPEAPCSYDSLPDDWVIRNEWAEYYMGKSDSILLLDSGTGIVRTVIFWRIPDRTKYYEGQYTGEILERSGREIGLWRSTSVPLASKGCAEESQAVVEQVTWVDVTTGKETPGEEYRCGFQE